MALHSMAALTIARLVVSARLCTIVFRAADAAAEKTSLLRQIASNQRIEQEKEKIPGAKLSYRYYENYWLPVSWSIGLPAERAASVANVEDLCLSVCRCLSADLQSISIVVEVVDEEERNVHSFAFNNSCR